MPGKSITAANAVYMISVTGLFSTPQQLQGFAADDVFSTENLQSAETQMGVDGRLSGGFVYKEIVQSIMLQADSDSNFIFEQWWAAQQTAAEVLTANATVILKNLNSKYTLTRGFLTGFSPLPDAKKLLQPRRFSITWNSVIPAAS
jgi:hypothetical protein